MTSRERVSACLSHEEPDRVPLAGEFRPEVLAELRKHLGVEDEEGILERFGIDFREVRMSQSAEFAERAILTHKMPKFKRMIAHEDGTFETEWGVRIRFDESGCYYAYVSCPLADESKLSNYKFPNLDAPGRFEEAQEQTRKYKEDYFVKAVGLATIHRQAWELRGYEQWLEDLMLNGTFVEKLSDLILEFELELVRRFARMGVDEISVAGDIAVANNLVMPPDIWRRYFKNREAKLIEEGKKWGVNHFFFHSDGNVLPVLADLVEIGFTIIDPIQPECMDPQEVKREFGDRITLHGTLSSQWTLPFGTVHDVKTEVEQRIMTLGRKGGLILAPVTVQSDVPLENIVALYDTARQTPLPKE